MGVNQNLNHIEEGVNENIEKDMMMQKIREELIKKLSEYRNTINHLAADAPISALCLPKKVEKCLLDYGLLRIYDLFNCDFAKIEGLDDVMRSNLTARFNEFFSVY